MRHKSLLAAAWGAALLVAHSACGSVLNSESHSLQLEFGTATNLRIVHRWQDVEGDAAVPLRFVGKHFFLAKPGYANIGEDWNTTDSLIPTLPQALHVLSAYTSTVTASVFLLGGQGTRFYALLARRGSSSFCIFPLPDISVPNLRVSVIQYELRPDRDETISQIPKCHQQALNEPLRLP